MTQQQQEQLTEHVEQLGYTGRYTYKDTEGFRQLYIDGVHISGVEYALALPTEELKDFIEVTLKVTRQIEMQKKKRVSAS